jgi:hypothetical protein
MLDDPAETNPSDSEELEPEAANPIELEELGEEADQQLSGLAPPDRRLITQPYDLAISDLVGQVESNRLHLQPVYQRRYVWDNKKASKLVESLLINVPIPVCYLAEEHDGTRSVIDGQQRLRSLNRFLQNEFALTGLEVLPDLNRKRFRELSDRQQRLISNRTIRCIVISEDSDPEIRFNVFERLNTGSVALTAQELRNSVYRGTMNDLLRELAKSSQLSNCLDGRSDARMAFEELVLRFLALSERLADYRPSLKRFLNEYMRRYQNLDDIGIGSRRDQFLSTAAKAHAVFGPNCFRRASRTAGDWAWLPQINSAVYDVVMLNFAGLSQNAADLTASSGDIVEALVRLMLTNEEFGDAISLATGDRARLFRRVRLFSVELAELGLSSGLEHINPE